MSLFARKNDEPENPRFVDATVRAVPTPLPAASSRQQADVEEEVCDYLGRGSRIQGKLRFEGSVRIGGDIQGEIEATETVVVEEGAEVSARISAAIVLVRGAVNADVHASVRLEIGATGVIRGKVVTGALVVEEGAVFEGACSMGGSRPKGVAKRVEAVEESLDLAAVPA
jgi:cytoskeletal protein CcmA (bactofilin family)